MPRKKPPSKPVTPLPPAVFKQARSGTRAPQRPPSAQPLTVSGQWLLAAASFALVAAAGCAWLTLCVLFWQGGWQLLYHPATAVARTPSSVGLAFDTIAFATTDAGEPRLKGWWIPATPDARYSRYTVLYLHGQNGNLSDTVNALAALHAVGANILAFDYRGYGQSQFARPSEARWREDAEWALQYLTATRHVAANSIILDGRNLGANLALEVAAAHPGLAGVVLESPLDSPVDALFHDPRARLVPAHLLVRDRYDADEAATALRIPSLWLIPPPASSKIAEQPRHPNGFSRITARKMLVWLQSGANGGQVFAEAFRSWLDDLPGGPGAP